MKAFEIKVNGKILDYRTSRDLNLDEVKRYFEEKGYIVTKIWQEKRHVVGILEKEGEKYFLKLSPTEGISATTQIDYNWNQEFNRLIDENSKFSVPKNFESGYYQENLFYIVEEYLEGKLLADRPNPNDKFERIIKNDLLKIIELSEVIQKLKINSLSEKDQENHIEYFLEKTLSWFNSTPKEVIEKYNVNSLLQIVTEGSKMLLEKPRHGDFTPWHMMNLANSKFGLIDGEHAMKNGVEYYDLSFFIERIFVVLKNPDFAKEIFNLLKEKNYDLKKLKVVLASRGIGAFLDSSIYFDNKPEFVYAKEFKDWVMNL